MSLSSRRSLFIVTIVSLLSFGGLANYARSEPPGEKFIYEKRDARELRVYVSKPKNWQANDTRPAIVFFHGGGWVSGSPGQFDPHAAYFTTRGLVCFQVEYRLLNKANQDPPQICIDDAVAAMKWVRSKSGEFGIDPQRIASAGGSAGGHLAAYLGTVVAEPDSSTEISAKSNAMLLFNPVYDNGPGGWGTARVGKRFQEFSPAHNVTKDDPPSIVFLGTDDKLVSVATAEKFRDNCKQVGIHSELHTYEGQPHGFFNESKDGGRWYRQTTAEADRFLCDLGWLAGAPTLGTADGE
jgi:acetyl esterase